MSKLEVLTGRSYLSHSSYTTYVGCGTRFWLERVANVPQTPAWYLVGGSSFHTASEMLDKGEMADPHEAWLVAWNTHYNEDITAKGFTHADVRAGGRASKEWPDKETDAWWNANGPLMLEQYVRWRDERFAEGWQWFRLPDDSPAIEVPVNFELAGVLLKGFIDRIMVNPDGELIVVDLKTGASIPPSMLQLGIYALGVKHHFGVQPILGAFYDARKGYMKDPGSLLHYTPELVGSWFSAARDGIEQERFIPNVTALCGSCSVRAYCPAFAGALPTSFDK